MEPLPHGFCLGDSNVKNGSIFGPILGSAGWTQKWVRWLKFSQGGGSKNGPIFGLISDTVGTRTWTQNSFCFHSKIGPSLASSRSAEGPWLADGRGTGSSVFESVASISSLRRCELDATRLRISGGCCLYLWPRRTAFPKRIAVEARRPVRCSAPQSNGANVPPLPLCVPHSVSFAGCHSSPATGQVFLQEPR